MNLKILNRIQGHLIFVKSLIKAPMLAVDTKGALNTLEYPLCASTKLDGIRCLIVIDSSGIKHAVTRNFKLIPNRFVRAWLEANCPVGLDGELMVRVKGQDTDFSNVTSGIMSEDGTPDFYYAVFDYVSVSLNEPFSDRYTKLMQVATPLQETGRVKIVWQTLLKSPKELEEFYATCLSLGSEGTMLRSPSSPYKCGRSTLREGYLLKVKPFDPDEAEIIGFNQLRSNQNDPELDAFGHTERSLSKDGMVLVNALGSFQCRDLKTKIEFDVGTGLTSAQRIEIWAHRPNYLGKILRYKHQGIQDKPRFPVVLKDPRGNIQFRDERDL